MSQLYLLHRSNKMRDIWYLEYIIIIVRFREDRNAFT